MSRRNVSQFVSFVGLSTVLLTSTVRANITGFDPSTFKINQSDTGSPPTLPSSGSIELTNGANESRSIFDYTPQNIMSPFVASFTYQVTGVNNGNGDSGATFVIENDARGVSATNSGGSEFGYRGIQPSVGVIFDLYYGYSGEFTNGTVGSGEASVSPVGLESGDLINVQLNYSGTTLVESLTDARTLASYSKTYAILTPFATTVGSTTAFIGISASTSNDAGNQYFSNFQFSSIPEPSTIGMAMAISMGLLARRRHHRGHGGGMSAF